MLILHELATDAAPYGALCREACRVSVSGTVDDPALWLPWRETGGPAMVTPTRRGGGTRPVARGLAGGEVRTSFDAAGSSCVLTTTLTEFGVLG